MEKPMLKQGWLSTELEAGKNEVKNWPEWMRREAEVREPRKEGQSNVETKSAEDSPKS
jgi:hypothetical protein